MLFAILLTNTFVAKTKEFCITSCKKLNVENIYAKAGDSVHFTCDDTNSHNLTVSLVYYLFIYLVYFYQYGTWIPCSSFLPLP